MTNHYKILFSVDILCDYYKDIISLDFDIVPSAETALLLKSRRLIYKIIANRLLVLVKVDDTGIPVIEIGAEAKFVFYLDLNKNIFINFSSIDLEAFRRKRFYFTNLNQNKANGFYHITRKTDIYNNAKPYKPGNFVDDGTGAIFECIQSSTGNNTTTNFWISRGNNQTAAVSDMLESSPKILNYTASSSAQKFLITVFRLNKATGDYTDTAKTISKYFEEDTKDIQIDLTSLKNGKYKIVINSDENTLYIDEDFVYAGYFGVIEIFSHLPNTNEFSFFEKIDNYDSGKSYARGDLADDGTGKIYECIEAGGGNALTDPNFWIERKGIPGNLKEINYTIHFANRAAYWIYHAKTNDVTTIEDSSLTYVFSKTSLDFVSNIPIPLTEEPVTTFSLSSTKFGKINALANPGPDRLTTISKNGEELLSAEINLIY
jgi:hypothetical protein